MSNDFEHRSNITVALETTLKNSDLQSVVLDVAEVGLDSLLNEGVFRDVPVIGAFVGLMKTGANIQDQLFLKKIIYFLSNLKDITPEDRKKFIVDIDNSKKFRVKVGEKILYIIDSCEDFEIAELVSKVLKYCLEGKITYEEFLKISSVLKDMNKVEFDWFLKSREKHYFNFELNDVGDLVHTGLFEIRYEQISVSIEKEWDHKVFRENPKASEYRTGDVDGGVSVRLSRVGEIVLEIFCPSYIKTKNYS